MNPEGTPIFEGTLCTLLKPPFMLTSHPIIHKKFALSPKDPMCFEFLIKSYKVVTQWPQCFWFFDEKKITSLFKKYETFHKSPSEPVTKAHFVWNFWNNTLFCETSPISAVDPSFLPFLPHWMPPTLKIGAIPQYLFYRAPGNLNMYLDDTFAITGPDSILFVSHGFV